MDDSPAVNLELEDLRWLRRLAHQLVQDSNDADDVVQEAVLAALTGASRRVRAPRSWLAKVLQNVVRQGRRGAARRSAREREVGVRGETPSTLDVVEELAWHRSLIDHVNSLAEPYRSTIVLRFLRDLSPLEIARAQEVPVKTVYTRMARGLGQLRDALDKRCGGDRAGWLPGMSAFAASADSGVPGTLLTGGIVVGKTLKVAAVVLVVAFAAYFVTLTRSAEPSTPAPTGRRVAERERALDRSGSTPDDPIVVHRRHAVPQKAPVTGDGAKHILRVVIEGITEREAQRTTVTLTAAKKGRDGAPELLGSWSCQGSKSEFDLDPLVAHVPERIADWRVDELAVAVDHPLHLIETADVSLSKGLTQSGGPTVYEARVQLVPGAVVHGRLLRPNGAPAAEGLVGALLLDRSSRARPTTKGTVVSVVPVDDQGRAVECASDGTFELRLPASGRYAVASYESGWRPTTTLVEVSLGARMDLGTLVLERGHAITGRALRHGQPMVGASISAEPPRVLWARDPEDVERGMAPWLDNRRTFTTQERSLRLVWLDGRFELQSQRIDVDEEGAFAFGALGSGEYRLRFVRLTASRFLPSRWDNPGIDDEGPDEMVVLAPARDVLFEFNWTSIRFELEGVLGSDGEGRLLLRTKSLYSGNERVFIPEFWSKQFLLSGDQPTHVFQAPPNAHLSGEVTFPGRAPVPLDFWTSEPGGEVVVPVRLVPGGEAATLVLNVGSPRVEAPETFKVLLSRVGREEDAPDIRMTDVENGQLRWEGIPPGKYRARVHAGGDRASSYPANLFFENELDVELHAGQVAMRSLTLRQGAGLRLTLRNQDGGFLAGQYELYDHLDNRVYLVLQVGGRASSRQVYAHGTHESRNPLRPGRYRLALISPGYKKRDVMVDLRAGEYSDLSVTLRR